MTALDEYQPDFESIRVDEESLDESGQPLFSDQATFGECFYKTRYRNEYYYIHNEIYSLKSRRVNFRSQTDVNQSNVAYHFASLKRENSFYSHFFNR